MYAFIHARTCARTRVCISASLAKHVSVQFQFVSKISAEVSYTCPSVSMLVFVIHLRLSVRIYFVRLCNIPTDVSLVYLSTIKLSCLSAYLSVVFFYIRCLL